MKHYRFVASVFLTALGYLLGHIYANKRLAAFTWWHNVVLVVAVYATVCWFVNIDADSAEGISTSFFAEHTLAKDYQSMIQAQQVLVDKYSLSSKRFKTVLTVTLRPGTETSENDLACKHIGLIVTIFMI